MGVCKPASVASKQIATWVGCHLGSSPAQITASAREDHRLQVKLVPFHHTSGWRTSVNSG